MTYYHSVVGILLRQHDQLINSGNQQGRKADNTIKGKEKMRNLFATTILLLLQIFGTILVSLLGIIWQSYLLQISINWFLEDMNMRLLSHKNIAISLILIRFITYQYIDVPDSKKSLLTRLIEGLSNTFFSPIIVFLFAYLIHRFM